MPLQPNGGKLLMPVTSEADVQALFVKALEFAQVAGHFTKPRYHADIQDHFYYIGAICPQYFRSLQNEVVNLPGELLSFMGFDFFTSLYLFQDAPDSCVDRLMQRLAEPADQTPAYLLEGLLAAIETPVALAAIAEYAERVQRQSEFHRMGFWLPGRGQSAEPRFTRQRYAARLQAVDPQLSPEKLAQRPHPVGLPISLVAQTPASELIAWHYATLDLTRIAGLPKTSFSRAHLVSSIYDTDWTLFCDIAVDNLYTQATLSVSERNEDDAAWLEKMREDTANYQNAGRGELQLLLYDDGLIYRNGHTQMTEGVCGDIGGPPLALHENPNCPTCHKLMFHICTLSSSVREYGNGFRSLFICEECRQVASVGMGWN